MLPPEDPVLAGHSRSHLLDLNQDCTRCIISLLSHKEACSLAKTCSRLAGLVSHDEEVWQRFCKGLLGPYFDAAMIRVQLRLSCYRALCQVLHQLGGLPLGLWRRIDSCSEPFGELIQVHVVDGNLVGRAMLPSGFAPEVMFTIRMSTCASVPTLTCAEASNCAGRPAEVTLQDGLMTVASYSLPARFWQSHDNLILRLGGGPGGAEPIDEVIAVSGAQGVADGLGHGAVPFIAAVAADPLLVLAPVSSPDTALCMNSDDQCPDEAIGLGPLVWDQSTKKWMRMLCRLTGIRQELIMERLPQQQVAIKDSSLTPSPLPTLVMHAPQRPLLSGASDALGLLSRLQGFWSACYGPHGVEIVQVQIEDPCQSASDRCPSGTTSRLVATKVTGDCNVPAGRVTLCTLDSNARLGRYSGYDEEETGFHSLDRPIVAFQESGMSYVDMAERDVAARFQARGQTNYVPGVWDPCWSIGQLITYEDDLPCFSMLFEDNGEHFRHIIDFTPLLLT